jgi:hypothetical protein
MTLQTRGGTRTLSRLQRAVYEAVAYADVFDFPVTVEEICRALPLEATSAEVEAALADGAFAGLVARCEGYITLSGRKNLVTLRRMRAEASAALMRRSRRWGGLIAQLPFVRMVAVTGSLAVENADAADDVDYLIVTAPGRLWLARAMTMAVVRLARLRGLTLCPNYLLAETALTLRERDVYTARELLQMFPIGGFGVHERMLAANAWSREVLPNWGVARADRDAGASMLARLGERLLGGRRGDALERWMMRRKTAELRSQAGDNSEAVFDVDVCKGHFDAHRSRLQAELARRMALLEAES